MVLHYETLSNKIEDPRFADLLPNHQVYILYIYNWPQGQTKSGCSVVVGPGAKIIADGDLKSKSSSKSFIV